MKTPFRLVTLTLTWVAVLCSVSSASLIVSGQANIFGAAHATAPNANGSGALPPVFTFVGETLFTFDMTGSVKYNGGGNFCSVEGGLSVAPLDINVTFGIRLFYTYKMENFDNWSEWKASTLTGA